MLSTQLLMVEHQGKPYYVSIIRLAGINESDVLSNFVVNTQDAYFFDKPSEVSSALSNFRQQLMMVFLNHKFNFSINIYLYSKTFIYVLKLNKDIKFSKFATATSSDN